MCGLPKKDALWDFTQAVEKTTHTFVVCLEVLSEEQKPKQPEEEMQCRGLRVQGSRG